MSASETLNKQSKQNERPKRFFEHDAFWRGVASAFNIHGYFAPKYYGRNPWQADREALQSDWEAMSKDMRVVMRCFEQEHAKELQQAGQARLFDPDAG